MEYGHPTGSKSLTTPPQKPHHTLFLVEDIYVNPLALNDDYRHRTVQC